MSTRRALLADLALELHEKACREALWLALFHARLLEWSEIEHQLAAIIVHVDELHQCDGL